MSGDSRSKESLTRAGRGARAVAYLRVSGLGQVDGDGFERQRQAIGVAARRMHIHLAGEFAEEGVSGTLGLAARPALARLIDAVLEAEREGDPISVMLVEKADRLARDLVEGELLLRELRRIGVRVIEAEGGQDLTAGDDTNPTAKLIRQVLGAVAEFEKSALVAKLTAARRRLREAGARVEGAKPFGELPGEDAAVARVRELRRKPRNRPRLSYAAVARVLAAEGFKTRTGASWSRQVVREIAERIGAA